MKVILSKEFRFEAAHRLDHLDPAHPCHNLHGHSYVVEVQVCGEVNQKTGFLIDYAEIRQVCEPIIKELDHKYLNDIDGLRLSSSEFIARWLWQRIKPGLPLLSKIILYETVTSRCEYWGE